MTTLTQLRQRVGNFLDDLSIGVGFVTLSSTVLIASTP